MLLKIAKTVFSILRIIILIAVNIFIYTLLSFAIYGRSDHFIEKERERWLPTVAKVKQCVVARGDCAKGPTGNNKCYYSIIKIQYFVNNCVYNSEVKLDEAYYEIIAEQTLRQHQQGEIIPIYVEKENSNKFLLANRYYTYYGTNSKSGSTVLFSVFVIFFPISTITIYLYVNKFRKKNRYKI